MVKIAILQSEKLQLIADSDKKQLEIIVRTKDAKNIRLELDESGNIELLINGTSFGTTIVNKDLLRRIEIQYPEISEEEKKSLLNFIREILQKIKENKHEVLEIVKITTEWVKIIIGFFK